MLWILKFDIKSGVVVKKFKITAGRGRCYLHYNLGGLFVKK